MVIVLLGMPLCAWGQEDETAGEPMDQSMEEAAAESTDESAEDIWSDAEAEEDVMPLHYMLEPEFRTWLGYRFVDVDGSNQAIEYGWQHSSVTGGVVLHYNPLPHRLDFELDWLNKHDYNAEFGYSYKDMIRLDYRGWSLFHNLDHYIPQAPAVSNLDGNGVYYGVTARDNRVFMRLKWPDRPYHVFAEFRQFEKEGSIQERFYTGVKVSRLRDIYWVTRRYTAGINGHFGPVEIEYSHFVKTFDPHKDVVTTAPAPATWTRSHIPELETNTDTVKIHTSLTGRVVATTTLINGEKENERSKAEAEFRRAYADLVMIPFEGVTVAVKYRYRELQVDPPDGLYGTTAFGTPAETKDSMDRRTNTAEVIVRYSPIREFSAKASYKFEKTERYSTYQWSDLSVIPFQSIPTDQNRHTVQLGFRVKAIEDVDFKGSLQYEYTQDPAYPVEAVNSYKGRFDARWSPMYNFNMDAYYRFLREDNNTADMDYSSDNIGMVAFWAPLDRFFTTVAYDFWRSRNERTLRLTDGVAPTNFIPESTAMRDTSHVYTVGAGYSFEFPLTLEADFHQSWSRSKYRTSTQGGLGTSSGMGELVDLKIRETGGSFIASYDLPKGWGTSVNYSINNYEDMQDKPQTGMQDGTAQSVILLVSKKW